MSLRYQLLAFGLLTLALPWVGLKIVQQMEAALRDGLEASLLASASTAATALANSGELGVGADSAPAAAPAAAPVSAPVEPTSTPAVLYAHRLSFPPRLDGFNDDWNFARTLAPASDRALELDGTLRVWSAVNGRFAYFFVEASDEDIVYQASPGASPYGDRVALIVGARGAERALVFSTAAPGVFRAQHTSIGRFIPEEQYEDRVLAAWQETADGFDVEMRVPIGLIDGAAGLGVIDVDRQDGDFEVNLHATWMAAAAGTAPFIYERLELAARLEQFTRAGDRYRLLSQDGWILADTGKLDFGPEDRVPDERQTSMTESFFRWALRRNDPIYDGLEDPPGRLGASTLRTALDGAEATAWYRQGPSSSAVVAASVPVRVGESTVGAVLLEQASDPVLTVANQALMRLMLFTVLASVITAAALLGYATFLSLRIRNLARATESAMGPRGEINVVVPGAAAGDEIGDLSRSFASLLGRLREHTEYLRTLASKLTHELRTPLAIVTTSVDNLEHEVRDEQAEAYLARLRQGTARLDSILSAMSAATQVEQAIEGTDAQVYDLVPVVRTCAHAYRDVYPDREFSIELPTGNAKVRGSPDLLAQLLDKLIENAVSFSEPGSNITIAVLEAPKEFELNVTNRGPGLPESMRRGLFDSLVSVRSNKDDRPHLGLGLYIVALIMKFHDGRVAAENLSDQSGVIVRAFFPRSVA